MKPHVLVTFLVWATLIPTFKLLPAALGGIAGAHFPSVLKLPSHPLNLATNPILELEFNIPQDDDESEVSTNTPHKVTLSLARRQRPEESHLLSEAMLGDYLDLNPSVVPFQVESPSDLGPLEASDECELVTTFFDYAGNEIVATSYPISVRFDTREHPSQKPENPNPPIEANEPILTSRTSIAAGGSCPHAALFEPSLEDGEKLIWTGKPREPGIENHSFYNFVFGLIATVTGAISFMSIVDILKNGVAAVVFSMVFGVAGLAVLNMMKQAARNRKHRREWCRYALTSKRILVGDEASKTAVVKSLSLQTIRRIYFRPRLDGKKHLPAGDIAFSRDGISSIGNANYGGFLNEKLARRCYFKNSPTRSTSRNS